MARIPEIIKRNNISQVAAQPKRMGVGFAALAELAEVGSDFIRPAALEDAAEQGAKSVYRDEGGQLQIDAKNVLGGELSDAHNAAAYSKYLAQRKIDIRENMTELAVQHQFNPAGFREASDAYIALMDEDENVPALLREDLLASAQNEASTRFNGLFVQASDRTNRESDRDTSTHRDLLADDYVNLIMAGDTEAAAQVYAELESITGFRQSADFISETPNESEAYLRGVRGTARVAQITEELSGLENADSITDERRAEIQALIDDPDITPAARQRLYGATEGVLKGIDGRALANSLAGTDVASAVRNFGFGGDFVTPGYLASIRSAESGGDDNARNPRSSATGRYQFTEGTWKDMMRKHPELGLTLDGRLNAEQQERAIVAFTRDNGNILQRNGISTSGGNLYAAHFLGAGDAVKVLGAPGSTQLTSLLSEQVINANPFLSGMDVDRFRAWSAEKGGDGDVVSTPVDFTANREALVSAGVSITPGSEFLAATADVSAAQLVFSVDVDVPAAPLLGEEFVNANPELANMTVGEVRNWAERRGTVKASDIAARRVQIDQIDDSEVRDIALAALNDQFNMRRRLEDSASEEYKARIEAQDTSLTTQQIQQDQSLSDQAQSTLTAALESQRAEQTKIQNTLSDLSNADVAFDAYDSSLRNDVDDAFGAMIGDQSPMSPEGQTVAAGIAQRTGFLPKTMFNAIRQGANSADPQEFMQAMEFAGQMLDLQPTALNPYGGASEVRNALSDYRYYSGLMDGQAAAERIIEQRSEAGTTRRQNLSDAAKSASENLKADQVIDHFGSNVTLGSEVQQGAVMADYERLFQDAFVKTGDEGLARARALDELSTVYGPNHITGDSRLMRFPPQNFYPNVPGRENWMQEQIVDDVSEYAFGDDVDARPEGLIEGVADFAANAYRLIPDSKRIDSENITITADERTRADIAAGRAPSYAVSYLDDDKMLQVVPGRYQFEVPQVTADHSEYDARRSISKWQAHFRAQGMSVNQIYDEMNGNLEKYSTSLPPSGE